MDCQLSLKIGQVPFATGVPQGSFLAAIHGVLESSSELKELASLVRDSRFDEATWKEIFHRELLQVFRWGLRRLDIAGHPSYQAERKEAAILSLLPRYGETIHLLRRAIPFAALGIPTICSFESVSSDAARIVKILSERLRLETNLRISSKSSALAVQDFYSVGLPVVLTGRLETLTQLRLQYTKLRIIASTGRCSVILGPNGSCIENFQKKLIASQTNESCTRFGARLTCTDVDECAQVDSQSGPYASKVPEGIIMALKRIHPSIVFSASNLPSQSVRDFVAGYRTVDLSRGDSDLTNFIGFGADPVGGWPGDYLI